MKPSANKVKSAMQERLPLAAKRRACGQAWTWGLVGAVVLAAAVGVAVYFTMDAAHRRSVDALVSAKVAEIASVPQPAPQVPPAMVKVAPVRKQMTQQRIALVGRLMELKRAVIASEVEGRLVELLTPAGRTVVGGQTVIARVDPIWSELAVEEAKADLASAEATAGQSSRELEHLESLALRNAADPQAVDDARAKAEADAAKVLALKALLHRAIETNKRVEIIAPFDGTVSKKLTEQGQWVDSGGAVVEVVSRGLIDAVIDVPEQFISAVGVGTPVEVTIDPLGETVSGEVIAVNPDGSNPSRSFPVKIRLDDRGGLLKVGMSVTAKVPVNVEKEYVVVPRDAVQYGANGPQVWMSVVMPGSAPGAMPVGLPMDVEVIFGQGEVFAVRAMPKTEGMDLLPGMEVVVEGAERLWPTRPLIVVPGDKPSDQATTSQAE